MATPQTAAARTPVEPPAAAEPATFEALLAKLALKDRVKIEKMMVALDETDAPKAALWRRLSAMLFGLAGHAVKLSGPQSLQFFVADGNYRMQVFALEDVATGGATVYGKDVLDEALKAGLVTPAAADTTLYGVPKTKQTLSITRLTGEGPTEHPPAFKDMLSWNRRVIAMTIPVQPTEAQLQTVEAVCRQKAKPVVKK